MITIISTQAESKPLRFVVISDSNDRYGKVYQGMGVDDAIEAIVHHIRPDFVIHNGDMIAGQLHNLSREEIVAMWKGYHNQVTYQLMSNGIPLVPVTGNHDADPRFVDREVYLKEWTRPSFKPDLDYLDDGNYPFFYAFSHGESAFIILDAPTGRVSPEQLSWLNTVLQDTQLFSYRFVFSHVPFAKFIERSYGELQPRDALYDLFIKYKVTLLFSGHYEIYYRGRFRDLDIVSTGQLSHTCRVPLGQKECQGMSIVVVEVRPNQPPVVIGLTEPDFLTVFDEDDLPPVCGENYLLRMMPIWPWRF